MMDRDSVDCCLSCNSSNISNYIKTATMMAPKSESWQFQKCTDCNLVFLNPRAVEHDLTNYYQDYYLPYRGPSAWGKYSGLVNWDLEKIDIKRLRIVKKYSSKTKHENTILDIGCGKPSFLKIAKQKGYKTIGIDFSDSGWKGNDEYDGINLLIGDPKNIASNIRADVITMWHYLEHDYDPFQTLSTLLNNAYKSTKLIIEVPNHNSLSRRKYGSDWAGYHTPRHTALYNLENMATLLERSGWKVVDSYSYGTLDPYTLDWMSRMEQREIDWGQNMEVHFKSFVIGKLIRPYYYLHKFKSMGFMTIVAEKA